jgi:hypothetical protein
MKFLALCSFVETAKANKIDSYQYLADQPIVDVRCLEYDDFVIIFKTA